MLARNPVISLDYKSGGFRQDIAFMAEACPDLPCEILNPSEMMGTGYNPFYLPKGAANNLSAHVSRLAEVILKTVSGEQMKELQNYATAAECFFAYLAVSNVPISHAMAMFDDPKLWLRNSALVPEEYARTMRRIGGTPKRDWDYKVGALERRLRPFATSEALRRLVACPRSVSVSGCHVAGISLFANATPSRWLSPEAGRIFLGIILSDILQSGLENEGKSLIYADEIEEYASPDFGSVLDLVLASGIRITAIHHFSGQLDLRSQESLSKNARIKVIFGGATPKELAELVETAYPKEMAARLHKQPRISFKTEYQEEYFEDTTENSGGSEGHVGEVETGSSTSGTSIRSGTRLRPHSEEVVTGYDDYGMDEKVAKLALNFIVPDRTCAVILPDKRVEMIAVPELRRYLYNSPETLRFKQPLPHEHRTERSIHAAPRSPRKNSAGLFHAE